MRQRHRRHPASRISATNLRDQASRATQPATRAEPRICPTSKSQKSLDSRLREPPEASGVPHRNPTSPRPGTPPRDPHFQADARPRAAGPAAAGRPASPARTPEKPRSPWPPNRIYPCPVTRTNGAPRTRPRPPAQPRRGKLWPDRGAAPGSLGRPGCWTRGRSSRTSPRSGCTWPPRARQPGRCRATPPQCAGSPPDTCSLPGGKDQLGAGGRPRYPAVDGTAAGPVQQRVRQHPVPGAAAVLQVAGRRGTVP